MYIWLGKKNWFGKKNLKNNNNVWQKMNWNSVVVRLDKELKLAASAFRTGEHACVSGEVSHKGWTLRCYTVCGCIDRRLSWSWFCEICTVEQQIIFWSPVPLFPFILVAVLPLRYFLGEGICRSQESIALTQDGGVCTSTDGIHSPLSVVVVKYMEVSKSAPTFI